MNTSFDNWLSYDPSLEYENNNPHEYIVTFRTKQMTLTLDIELDDPTSDMDDNYTHAKNMALFYMEERFGCDPQAILYENVETTVQVRK